MNKNVNKFILTKHLNDFYILYTIVVVVIVVVHLIFSLVAEFNYIQSTFHNLLVRDLFAHDITVVLIGKHLLHFHEDHCWFNDNNSNADARNLNDY